MIRFHFWKFSLEGMSRLRRVCIFTCHILFSHSEFRHKFCDDLWNHERILHFISMSAFDLRLRSTLLRALSGEQTAVRSAL